MNNKDMIQNETSPRFDLLFIGAALVDSIIKGFDPEPVSATGYRAESGSLCVGGEAVNGSVAAAKLGAKAAILCHLGNDAAGAMIKSELKAHGVEIVPTAGGEAHGGDIDSTVRSEFRCVDNTPYAGSEVHSLVTDPSVRSEVPPTPVSTLFVAADGSRKSITNAAHRYNFHPERYTGFFTDTKAIVLGSLFRAPFDDPAVILSVVRAAHSAGVTVFADTKLPNFRKMTLSDLAEALPMIDYITPNEDEARFYTGENEPEKQADVFLDAGVRNVIIKLGPKGCYFKNREGSICLPACKVRAVDATGAGDAFLAGFASELVRGSSVREALIFGNACGAVCCTAVGAGTALRDRAEVLKLSDQ